MKFLSWFPNNLILKNTVTLKYNALIEQTKVVFRVRGRVLYKRL